MFRIVLLATLVAVGNARRSPGADALEKWLESSGLRYSNNIIEDALLDVPGLVTKYGYPIELHNVTTSDGYILEAHRIPHGRDQNNFTDTNKPVVLLVHGMYSSSADFIVLGPGNALAYLLAEAGYDVWLANARGNFYSRKHVTLDPDDRNLDFWRFSWDEIGNYDHPALIDYILETTGHSKMHYIGHSQGTTTFFVLNSLRPEYNEKFLSFQALAPSAYFVYNEDPLNTLLSPYEAFLERLLFRMGIGEIFGNRELFIWFATNYCIEESMISSICDAILIRGDPDYYNTTMTPLFFGHSPAGASIRQMTHYAQCINTKTFRRYNHLPIKNLEVYGQPTPPLYELDKITAPNYFYYSIGDVQTNYKDVLLLSESIPGMAGMHLIERESFSHTDYLWGIKVKEEVYDYMIEVMQKIDSESN